MFQKRKTPVTKLVQDKLDIIDYAFSSLKTTSFADLGGVWGVDGAYTYYSLDKYKISRAILVDRYITNVTREQGKKHLQLNILQGDFGSKHISEEVGQVDALFLFDILLHQVDPNWDRVLEIYAPNVRCLIIYNQQWIGTSTTVRLLDLGEEGYFQNVPHKKTEKTYDTLFQSLNQKHPDQNKLWRDAQNFGSGALRMLTSDQKLSLWAFICSFLRIVVKAGIQGISKTMHSCSANSLPVIDYRTVPRWITKLQPTHIRLFS